MFTIVNTKGRGRGQGRRMALPTVLYSWLCHTSLAVQASRMKGTGYGPRADTIVLFRTLILSLCQGTAKQQRTPLPCLTMNFASLPRNLASRRARLLQMTNRPLWLKAQRLGPVTHTKVEVPRAGSGKNRSFMGSEKTTCRTQARPDEVPCLPIYQVSFHAQVSLTPQIFVQCHYAVP